MTDGGESIVRVARQTLRTCVRGMVLAVTAVAALPLFLACLASVLLLPVGLGVVLAPKSLLAVRRHAGLQRRRALEWSGVTIAAPYRPWPAKPTSRLFRAFRRCKWVLGDPATWRDLLWTLVNTPVSVVLGLLPAFLLFVGAWTVGVDGWILLEGHTNAAPQSFLLQLFLLSTLPACVIAGPWLLKLHAAVAASLLAPTRKELAARVGQLTESRWDAVDASAAELRRIERDLHDGAQARLVALGLNIGFAEQMVKDDPDLALTLLAEARESSGKALSELRALVRGIYPPALAERGLDGAVRSLALTLPLPVDLHIELPGGTGGAHPRAGGGLRGIERRLNAFDGMVAVTSPAGGPTQVTMELPCELSLART